MFDMQILQVRFTSVSVTIGACFVSSVFAPPYNRLFFAFCSFNNLCIHSSLAFRDEWDDICLEVDSLYEDI